MYLMHSMPSTTRAYDEIFIANDEYPVAGTYTVTGACTDSGSFAGLISGAGGIFNSTLTFYGSVSPSGDGIYDASFNSAKCNPGYQGSLTRQ